MPTGQDKNAPPLEKGDLPPPLEVLIDAVARLKFGSVQATVHEGKLVQIDVTERQRFSY